MIHENTSNSVCVCVCLCILKIWIFCHPHLHPGAASTQLSNDFLPYFDMQWLLIYERVPNDCVQTSSSLSTQRRYSIHTLVRNVHTIFVVVVSVCSVCYPLRRIIYINVWNYGSIKRHKTGNFICFLETFDTHIYLLYTLFLYFHCFRSLSGLFDLVSGFSVIGRRRRVENAEASSDSGCCNSVQYSLQVYTYRHIDTSRTSHTLYKNMKLCVITYEQKQTKILYIMCCCCCKPNKQMRH